MAGGSAGSMNALGESTWGVTTATPCAIIELVASASLTGNDQSPVKITCVVAFGLTVCAPRVKALMLRRTCGIGLAAGQPSMPPLPVAPGTLPARSRASSMSPAYLPGLSRCCAVAHQPPPVWQSLVG